MIKRLALTLALTFALALPATVAFADQTWDTAVEKAWLARDLVPATVETKTEIFDGGGDKLEIVDTIERLNGWKGSEPVMQKNEKRTTLKKSGVKFELGVGINANPLVAAHDGRVSTARKGTERIDGLQCAVYTFEERPADPKGKAHVGEVWIDSASGAAVKIVSRYKTMPKNVSAYELTTHYTVADGLWTPTKVQMDAAGGVLFFRRTVKVEKTFTGWTRRPGA
jgi:hypothetical protein